MTIRHEVGVPGLKRVLIFLLLLLPASWTWLSCGGGASNSTQVSGFKYRAFISNRVSAGSIFAGVYIVNVQTDLRSLAAPLSAGATPGMMVLTPNRAQTLVFSGDGTQFSDNQLTIINNATETSAAHMTLPGMTESIVVSPDSSTAYVAVPEPTVVVQGQSPGVAEAISLSSGAVIGQVNIPSVHYLSIDNSGNRILAFSDVLASLASPCDQTPSFLFIITPSQVGIAGCPAVPVPGLIHPFDHPVTAFFTSDDSTAYVVNCGAECGGLQASVQKLEMTPAQCLPDGVCKAVAVAAASVALVNGSTMYLAGTPYTAGGGPSLLCSTGPTATQAQYCGMLTIVDLSTMAVTNSGIVITDGYHNRIALGSDGQLFIGARNCTEIVPGVQPPSGAETRGCLSIYNTLTTAEGTVPAGGVVIPPETGAVTGIQPIPGREVVYVVQGQGVQGGTLYIYDTTTDLLDAVEEKKINNLIGDFVDVKTVDF